MGRGEGEGGRGKRNDEGDDVDEQNSIRNSKAVNHLPVHRPAPDRMITSSSTALCNVHITKKNPQNVKAARQGNSPSQCYTFFIKLFTRS